MSSKTPMPYMSLHAQDSETQRHPGKPDQPCQKRSTQKVQAEKVQKVSMQAERDALHTHNIQEAAIVKSQLQAQVKEKLASAHHPPPTRKRKVMHPRTKALVPKATAAKDDEVMDVEEASVAIPDKEGKSEEEEALDESGSEVEQSKPKKKLKKAGHGQLWMAIQSAQCKNLPGEWMTGKHKAGVQEELTQVELLCEDDLDFDKLRDAQPSDQLPCNDLIVEKANLCSHSPSSGKSFSSSSQPQSLPISNDDSEGGIADDARERLSMECNHLSGKPLHPEVLKSCYSRSMSTTVHLQIGLVDSIAHIVPTTSVPTFIKPSMSAQSHFINEVTPHIFELFGIINAWEQPSLADLQKIWKDVFPKECNLSSQTTEGVIALKLEEVGECMLEALEEIMFNDPPTNDTVHQEWWCSWALTRGNDHCQPFYYTVYNELEGSPPIIKGIFQSPLIATVLGMHMSWLSAIDEDVRSDKKPVGALAKCAIMWWETSIMVKPQKPLNEYSKANWGDCIEAWEGHTTHINMASDLIAVISQLKEKQWDKILKTAQASRKVKKWMMHTVSETPEPSEATLVELRDNDSDLMDED
ncbi:hypothetical protein EI94DRAFT_1809022 [Lactarius quietus]|nr:hypothetical protein EI94DRAFT_1809022 [Lactarius quietus]